MSDDKLVENLVSLFKGLRYSQRTWAEDARDIIAMVRENTPETGQHRLARQAAPIGNAQEHRASGRRSFPFSYEF